MTSNMGRGATATGSDTRERILRAAEALLAEQGIDGVSLREINREAGQNNTGAVQYYFGDRAGLVRAVLARHRRDDEMRRNTLLDAYESAGRPDLGALAGALVMPLAAKLSDDDGGRHYLRISAEFYLRASLDELVRQRVPDTSFKRWSKLLGEFVPLEDKALPLRFPAVRFTLMELARRAASPPRRDDQLFISHLTDLVTAMLGARASAGTTRLLEARTARKRSH